MSGEPEHPACPVPTLRPVRVRSGDTAEGRQDIELEPVGAGDVHAGQPPDLVASAHTYNTRDERLTTNYAIDRARGTLVLQGSREGAVPAVSPNTGQLHTVGPLGLGALADASFDISDLSNTALAAVRSTTDARTRLARIDLASGRATVLGPVGDGTAALRGLAIVP